jgi:pseudouridine synthase, rluA family
MIKRFIVEEESILLKDYLAKKKIFANTLKDIKQGNGQFLVNDQVVENWFLLKKNDLLEIVFPVSIPGKNIRPIHHSFEILYEDSYLLIINKENNLATIPTRMHFEQSLANYVMAYYKQMGIATNIHFVGRLDYATSGIIILAKSPYILSLMKEIEIVKDYVLEVKGNLKEKSGEIITGIEKDPNSVIKRRITGHIINSKTTYQVLNENENTSIIKATLHTGKTHQLRLHFAFLGYPIIGDELYGKKEEDGILHLHSYHTRFIHPITNQEIRITNLPLWAKKRIS